MIASSPTLADLERAHQFADELAEPVTAWMFWLGWRLWVGCDRCQTLGSLAPCWGYDGCHHTRFGATGCGCAQCSDQYIPPVIDFWLRGEADAN